MKYYNEKIIYILFGISLGVFGLSLVVIYANWQTALGIFLFAWGQNIDLSTKL